MIEENEMADTGLGTYKISIHLTTGQIREHVYPMSTIQEVKEVQAAMNLITNSFGKKTWNWKILQSDIPQIIPLQHPDTVYNPSYILFIEHGSWKKVKP